MHAACSRLWTLVLTVTALVGTGCARDAVVPTEQPDPASWFVGEEDRTTPAPDIPASTDVARPDRRHAADMALRVFVVDDNERFLQAARGLLEREGVTVVGTAMTAADALEQARVLEPDVSLVDIDLGGDSGFDLARRLDGDERVRSRIILISTHAEGDFADLIASSPAVGFLSKSRLSAEAIRALLDGRDGEMDGPA